MTLSRAFPKERIDTGPHDVAPSADDADRFVRLAEIGDGWLHPDSSNYTFVVELRLEGKTGFGVYKPQSGEAPLWDFPAGTLYRRECAAYDLSCLLQWPIVPPTAYRDGELGVGSLQLYVPPVGDRTSSRCVKATPTSSSAWRSSTSSRTTPTARAGTVSWRATAGFGAWTTV